MNVQAIILASVFSAAVIIVLLVVGAGLTGFLTAWFYQKAFFTPIIKRLEEEKEQLNKRIDNLNNEISGLKNRISELEKNVKEKEEEIGELKARLEQK